MTMDMDGRDLSLDQAAARLGISRDAARKRAERGSFPGALKIVGEGWSIPADALDARPTRTSADMSRTDVRPDASTELAEAIRLLAEAIRAMKTPDALDAPRPGKPAPWWRWFVFGEVRARE